MNFKEYQDEVCATFKQHENLKDEMCDWTVSLCEEAGEVASLVKHWAWGGEFLDAKNLAKEVGDVLWYLAAICTTARIDFEVVAELNRAKLAHRYNGEGFSVEKSQNRHAAEEAFEDTERYKELMKRLLLGRMESEV